MPKTNNKTKPKKQVKRVKEYKCTICGGDATVSFQGMYDKNGLDMNGKKCPFKKNDRPCLKCLYKKTGFNLLAPSKRNPK